MKITVRVDSARQETPGVRVLELVPVGRGNLPPFEPGAHIDVHLPNGMVRSYSLTGPAEDASRYVIGVLHDRHSRGGSRYIHQQLAVGDEVAISLPRNNFALDENARASIFVAGGIGITPIIPMLRRALSRGHKARLLYAGRTRPEMAFLPEIETLGGEKTFHFDDEAAVIADIRAYLELQDKTAHFYCCGPVAMIDSFERICAELGIQNVHVERFAARPEPVRQGPDSPFVLHLARSGKQYTVSPGETILQVLLGEGVDVDFSCSEGVCGTCEARVLAGVPDHRDSILSPAERASNRRIMVCVSRCQGDELTLDL